MKNLLITLMVLLIAGTAVAGDMTYKVYGKLHTSINMANNGDQSALTMTSNTSRFGVKGGVELNENFTAIYQFESSIDIADKGGTLSNRNSYLGLKGKFGAVLAGIHDTPFKTLGRKVTFFKDTVGDFRTATAGYDLRLNDVVMYVTPKHEMYGGQLAYQMDQNDWTNEDVETGNIFSGMAYVTPMEGDLFLGVAFENWSAGKFIPMEVDGIDASTAIRVAVKYNAEKFAVAGLFQTVSNYYTLEDWDATTFGGEILYKAAPKFNIKGNFYSAKLEDAAGGEGKFTQMAFGVDHVFAPRTTFYAQVAMINNDDGMNMGIGGVTMDTGVPDLGDIGWGNGFGDKYSAAADEDEVGNFENPMAFSVGVIHSF